MTEGCTEVVAWRSLRGVPLPCRRGTLQPSLTSPARMAQSVRVIRKLGSCRVAVIAGMPPSELVQLLGQQPNGQQVARDKLGRLTRFLSDFVGVMHLELRHPQATPVVLQMDAS